MYWNRKQVERRIKRLKSGGCKVVRSKHEFKALIGTTTVFHAVGVPFLGYRIMRCDDD